MGAEHTNPDVTITVPLAMARYVAGYLTATFAEERRNDTLDGWVADLIDALEQAVPVEIDCYMPDEIISVPPPSAYPTIDRTDS